MSTTFDPVQDAERLGLQLKCIRNLMLDGYPRSLREIQLACEKRYGRYFPEASISRRLRELRESKYGGFEMVSTRVSKGLWDYRIVKGETE